MHVPLQPGQLQIYADIKHNNMDTANIEHHLFHHLILHCMANPNVETAFKFSPHGVDFSFTLSATVARS